MKSKKNLNNIYLIGPMGAGKTAVGRELSKLTSQIFYDSDQEIEKRTGADIPWIFEKEGEAGFRKREADMIKTLCGLDNIILSTGGGAVLIESNRHNLSENGIVVYLMVSIDTQLSRIQKGQTRPLFLKNNSKEKLQHLNERRDPLYRAIADFTYQTDDLKPGQLATQILTDIEKL